MKRREKLLFIIFIINYLCNTQTMYTYIMTTKISFFIVLFLLQGFKLFRTNVNSKSTIFTSIIDLT